MTPQPVSFVSPPPPAKKSRGIQVVKLLKAGGKVNVAASSQGGEAAAAALRRALTFAGFLNVAANPEDPCVLTGERAAWETGASAPVRLSFSASKNGSLNRPNGNGSGAAAAATSKTWKLALDDDEEGAGGAEDDDLIDEDALLESSAPVKRASETVRRMRGGAVFFCPSWRNARPL